MPPALYRNLLVAKDLMLLAKYKKLLKRNQLFKESSRNKSIFLIGNGPSLNDIDLTLLESLDCMTCNFFGLHPLAERMNIVAHCVGDPCSENHNFHIEDSTKHINAASYWFHYSALDYVPARIQSKAHFYVPCSSMLVPSLFKYSLTAPTLDYRSSLQMAILLAIFMGYRNIILLGCDHDWLATPKGSPHFYGFTESTKKADDIWPQNYLSLIDTSRPLFYYYQILQHIAKSRNINIVNASSKSFLDCFTRRSYLDCLKIYTDSSFD